MRKDREGDFQLWPCIHRHRDVVGLGAPSAGPWLRDPSRRGREHDKSRTTKPTPSLLFFGVLFSRSLPALLGGLGALAEGSWSVRTPFWARPTLRGLLRNPLRHSLGLLENSILFVNAVHGSPLSTLHCNQHRMSHQQKKGPDRVPFYANHGSKLSKNLASADFKAQLVHGILGRIPTANLIPSSNSYIQTEGQSQIFSRTPHISRELQNSSIPLLLKPYAKHRRLLNQAPTFCECS